MVRTRVVLAALPMLWASPRAAHTARHDFEHVPVVAQEIQHPVPLFVVYAGPAAVTRVMVRYRTRAMVDWASLELKRRGAGWAVTVPCDDLVRGELRYYFNAFDEMGDVVATGGDREAPYRTAIVRDRVADPPHLPGEPPPSACIGASDCPPTFPGCKEEPHVRDQEGGELCEASVDCASEICTNGVCRDAWEAKRTGRRFWLGGAVALDLQALPGRTDVCATPSSAWTCVDDAGAPFVSRRAIAPTSTSRSDQVHGGIAAGNVRLLASFDYALTGNWLVGARIGGVLGGTPDNAAFPPLHVETRTSWVFGDHPVFNAGLAPFVTAAIGFAPFEARTSVTVVDATSPVSLDAWHRAGPVFVGAGAGLRLGIGTRTAVTLGARIDLAFGKAYVTTVTPDLGVQLGL